MTYDELLAKIEGLRNVPFDPLIDALRAVVELHEPMLTDEGGEWPVMHCTHCGIPETNQTLDGKIFYPCKTIEAIVKEMK